MISILILLLYLKKAPHEVVACGSLTKTLEWIIRSEKR